MNAADDWARWSGGRDPWARARRRAQAQLVDACGPPRGLFLDLGGGDGALASLAAARGWRAVTVDLAPARGIRAHFDRLPVRVGTVAVVAFCASLHWSPDILGTLREARRVLDGRGRIAVALTPLHATSAEAERAAATTRRALVRAGAVGPAATGYRHLTHAELDAALDAAAFAAPRRAPGIPAALAAWRRAKAALTRRPYADFPLVVADAA